MAADRWALITGASAGIGREFARVFAREGFHVVLVARREKRLGELARELEHATGVRTLVVADDLADPAAPERIFAAVRAEGVHVDALVNNAGFGSRGYFRRTAWVDHAAFLQVMVTAVVHLTHLFEPGMLERRYGRILNVASVAGLLPGSAGRTLYAAAKSFVVKFSEALALEHQNDGVHVTALCPGLTYSEFHDVVGNRDEMRKIPKLMWMDAETVARQGFEAVMAGKTVAVSGTPNRALAAVAKIVPEPLALELARRSARRTGAPE